MDKWENKCLYSLKRGQGMPEFISKDIDPAIQTLIRTKLLMAKSKDEVKSAFRLFKNTMRETMLINSALKLTEDLSEMNKSHDDSK